MSEKIRRFNETELMTTNWMKAEKEWCRSSSVDELESRLEEAEELLLGTINGDSLTCEIDNFLNKQDKS